MDAQKVVKNELRIQHPYTSNIGAHHFSLKDVVIHQGQVVLVDHPAIPVFTQYAPPPSWCTAWVKMCKRQQAMAARKPSSISRKRY